MGNEMAQRVKVPIMELDNLSSRPWDPHGEWGGDGERMDCCKVFSDLQEPTTYKHPKERNKNVMKMNKQININPPQTKQNNKEKNTDGG